jgi:hypothetical protein
MDKAVLVNIDLEAGSEILRILDHANLRVAVALWAHLPEYGDWRLVLGSRKFDAAGPLDGYGLLHDALNAASFPLEKTPSIVILSMTDPFIRALRRIFGKTKSVDGMRLGGQMIGDRFVEDAFAYRVA